MWNLAVEQHSHWRPGRSSGPAWSEQCRQLTEARAGFDWLAAGNVDVQQQALRDYQHARNAFFNSGFGHPTWRRKYKHEGFRVIGNARLPAYRSDGTPELNRTGKQVQHRHVGAQKLNKKWAQVKIPGAGWVKFRLTVRTLPDASTCRVTWKNGQWHVAFAVQPDPTPEPGNGEVAGVDRGVTVTAAMHDGTHLNCPQPSVKERAKRRKHERRAARAPKNSQAKADEHAQANKLKAREANVRKDWCEKTSTMLARSFDAVKFEDLNIRNMTRSARGTVDQPGRNVRQKGRVESQYPRARLGLVACPHCG